MVPSQRAMCEPFVGVSTNGAHSTHRTTRNKEQGHRSKLTVGTRCVGDCDAKVREVDHPLHLLVSEERRTQRASTCNPPGRPITTNSAPQDLCMFIRDCKRRRAKSNRRGVAWKRFCRCARDAQVHAGDQSRRNFILKSNEARVSRSQKTAPPYQLTSHQSP